MNWATAIPLVSVLAVVFTAGIAWARLSAMEQKFKDLKDEHMRSAESQGRRIEKNKDDIGTLMDWRSQVRGAERQRRADTKGIPVQDDDQ